MSGEEVRNGNNIVENGLRIVKGNHGKQQWKYISLELFSPNIINAIMNVMCSKCSQNSNFKQVCLLITMCSMISQNVVDE